MFDIINLVFNIFVMLSGSEQHNDQETKKLIVRIGGFSGHYIWKVESL